MFFKKILSMIITILFITLITFSVFEIIPGDPILSKLGIDADEAQIQALKSELDLDSPFPVRYINWLESLFKGDLGKSIRYEKPVLQMIKDRVPVTFSMAFMSIIIIILIGVPLGIISAKNNNKFIGTFISFITQFLMSIPSFWIGIILIFLFGLIFRIFSTGGYVPWSQNPFEAFKALFLPSLAISIPSIAVITRYTKNTIIEEMNKPYTLTAYSKGIQANKVLLKHNLRNALIPVITILGMIIGNILGGSIIIEQVFSLPGIGRLLINAISTRDIPLVQGLVLYLAFIVVFINFMIDILYVLIDPRVKTK